MSTIKIEASIPKEDRLEIQVFENGESYQSYNKHVLRDKEKVEISLSEDCDVKIRRY